MKIKPAILREALIERTGPVILFDYESIEANFKKFRRISTESNATWSMAVKALARPEIMEVARTYVDGFDISNIAEWNIIKPVLESHHMVWLTNGNLLKELDFFLKEIPSEKLLVTVNDMVDYDLIKMKNVPYLIRIGTSELTTQTGDSRFGLKLSELSLIKTAINSDKNFKGFHFHQGLEDHNYKVLTSILTGIKTKLADFAGKNLMLNLGGSFQLFNDHEIQSSLNLLKDKYKLHIEPGRALFRDAGFAMAPIEKYLMDGDCLRLFTRLSFINHLKWSKPNFAGILNMNDKIETITAASLVLEGPTCYEFDKSEKITLDTPLAFTHGSLIVLDNISGYSSEWNTAFNGVTTCEVKFVGRRRPDSP